MLCRWDEAHFGKFGSYYLKGTFYFDVHPPLGKMLVGLAGWLSGYKSGWYEFKSGERYPESVPYAQMRMLLAVFGAVIPAICYKMCRRMGLGGVVAGLVALMAACEVGLIGISRLILLDSMLIFFATAALASYVDFRVTQAECLRKAKKGSLKNVNDLLGHSNGTISWAPFKSVRWWVSLALTGLFLGAVSSVKWVGLFTVALVGCLTIEELWGRWWVRRQWSLLAAHFMARALCLIGLPVAVYFGSFVLHFALLHRSGPGDGNMSSLFQARLDGSTLLKQPPIIHYGSQITLKSGTWSGGLLHSHPHVYPSGSHQQQVTTYHHKDDNNYWHVLGPQSADGDAPKRPLKHGDVVRLVHSSTGKALHSHAFPAPLTKSEREVSGYGTGKGNGDPAAAPSAVVDDPNDLWQVLIVDDIHPGLSTSSHGQIRALTTKFVLRHVQQNCLLRSRNMHLPAWGFKQGEVSCRSVLPLGAPASSDHLTSQIPSSALDGTVLWNVEEHRNNQCKPL